MENLRRTTADEHAALSREFVRHAQEEFDRGDRLQASEKAWGAAAHAVKAIAAERGWNHDSHRLLFDVVTKLSRDTGNPALSAYFREASSLHQNFYENWQSDGSVQDGINQVKALVELLEEVRVRPAMPSVVIDARQWERLTRSPAE